eukprot:Hpha_TRINITY_DN15753_c4_g15::TRINITY_DN15753_c4_g15_i1::g.39311::m.39311
MSAVGDDRKMSIMMRAVDWRASSPPSPVPAAKETATGVKVEVSEVACRVNKLPCKPGVLTAVLPKDQEPLVWTATGDGRLVVRNAAGEEVFNVGGTAAPLQPTALCVSGENVWVGCETGLIHIFDFNGKPETVLQNALIKSAAAPVTVMCSAMDRVWCTYSGKDITEWNASTFSVTRILGSQHLGDLVTTLLPVRLGLNQVLFAGSRRYIRMWDAEGMEGPHTECTCTSLAMAYPHNQLWAATLGGVVVFSASECPTERLSKVTSLPSSLAAAVLQVMYIPTADRMWVFERDVMKIYNPSTIELVQEMQTPDGFCARSAYAAYRRECLRVWIVGEEGMTIKFWDAPTILPPTMAGQVPTECELEAQRDTKSLKAQVKYLEKKLRYVQSVGTIFRQRIGILFREKFRNREHAVSADWEEMDVMYKQSLAQISGEQVRDSDVELSPDSKKRYLGYLALEKQGLEHALNESLDTAAAQGKGVQGDVMYWREKAKVLSDELKQAKEQVEQLSAHVEETGLYKEGDLRRAHHICSVLHEKNELHAELQKKKEELEARERKCQLLEEANKELHVQLSERVARSQQLLKEQPLRGEGMALERSPSTDYEAQDLGAELVEKEKKLFSMRLDQMSEDNEKYKAELATKETEIQNQRFEMEACRLIRRQNNLLKQRLEQARRELADARKGTTNQQDEMQGNMTMLMSNISQLQTELASKDKTLQELSVDKLSLMQDVSRMNALLERYKAKVLTLEREQITRAKAEQLQDREHRQETKTLCESLDNRESRIQQLQTNFMDISEQLQHQIQQVARTNHELDLLSRENMTLKSRLQQLELLLEERREFSGLLGEVQGRMEMAVEELKSSQSTAELACELANLECRVGGLATLESQLTQKDDVIALRDDEIQRLKLRLAMFEKSINDVSNVFLEFPQSIEEMEAMLVENEEFRKVASGDAELQERARLRRAELERQRTQRSQRAFFQDTKGLARGSLDAATTAMLARLADSDSDSETQDDTGRTSGTLDATARLKAALGMDSDAGSLDSDDDED